MTARPSCGCAGPLVWHTVTDPADDTTEVAAILECPCGYVVITGNFNDDQHANTPVLRSHA
jgi:hypothetical protein